MTIALDSSLAKPSRRIGGRDWSVVHTGPADPSVGVSTHTWRTQIGPKPLRVGTTITLPTETGKICGVTYNGIPMVVRDYRGTHSADCQVSTDGSLAFTWQVPAGAVIGVIIQ